MERYLEGEEISHDEIVTALEDGTDHGHIFPVTCGVATSRLGAEPAARRDRRRPALARPARRPRARGHDARARPRTARCSPTSSRRAPTRSRAASTCSASTRAPSRTTRRCSTPAPTHKERIGQLLVPQGKEVTHADAFGPGDIGAVAKLKETRAGDWLAGARRADRDAVDQAPGAGHGVRDRAEVQGRRGQGLHRPAPPAGGGPDDRPAPRRADRRADRRRALADPRRGDRRADARALRRRGRRSSRRACPTRRRSAAAPRRTAGTRSRPAAAASSATATSRSSRSPRRRLRVRQRDQGRRDPDGLHPRGREGRARGDAAGRRRRLPGQGRARAAVRRLLPLGRLVGDGLQDRRLDRHEGGAGAGRRGAARADHARHRLRARERRRRRHGRPVLAPRAPARHRGRGRHDRGQGRGPDGGDAHLRARPALAHRRPGRVHDGVPALRGGPGATWRRRWSTRPTRRRRSGPELPLPRGGASGAAPATSARTRATRLRHLRADAAARRARGDVPGRRLAPPGLRAVHRAGPARGLDPRVRRRRARAAPHRAASGRGRSFLDRLRTRRERAREVQDEIAAAAEGDARHADAPEPGAVARRPAPARRGAARAPRHVRAVPTNADLKMQRALEVFNASDHTRTVGGVARSLGAPGVSRPPADRAPQRGRDHRDVGALLVPLRDRPVRRGRRRPARRAGRRARRALRRRAGGQCRRRRARSLHLAGRLGG